MAIHLFLDSNVFLQCKDIKELPWASVTEDQDIILIVCSEVQSEIDRLKGDGKNRRSKRARKASQLFRSAINATNEELEISRSNPKVVLSFPNFTRINWSTFPELDPSYPDHRYIAEAMTHANQGHKTLIVTHDTGPILKAKRLGVGYFEVPEAWLLEPETDERDKQILKLKNEIREIQLNEPSIKISLYNADEKVIEGLELNIKRVEGFDENEIALLVEEFQNLNPKKEFPFDSKNEPSFRRNRREIDNYSESYSNYLSKLRSFYENLPKVIESETRKSEIIIKLENNGRIPAKNLLVELEVGGNLYLSNRNNEKNPEFPKPPDPPKLAVRDLLSEVNRMSSYARNLPKIYTEFLLPDRHDPQGFYWKDRLDFKINATGSLVCDEFRHQTNHKLSLYILCPDHKNGHVEAYLNTTVSASNLPNPLRKSLPIKVNFQYLTIKDCINQDFLPTDWEKLLL